MRNRGNIYLSLLLIIAGLYLLLVNLLGPWLHLWWDALWPGVLLLAALAFYLPIAVWWGRRPSLAGLAVPGTIFLANAAILFYNTLTGDWDAWAYLWALEPLAVAAGLYLTWLLGVRSRGLLIGALILGLVGLGLFLAFGILFGSVIAGVVAPFVLIALGLWLLVRGVWGRAERRPAMRT
jgi:hypothetical protein